MSIPEFPENSSKVSIPGPLGGRLIRECVAFFKQSTNSIAHIHIALSGGPDSVALATVLGKYGGWFRARGVSLHGLHINHHWRGKDSDRDQVFCSALADELRLDSFRSVSMPSEFRDCDKGESLEERARAFRRQVFSSVSAEQENAVVWVAHHQDDVAETVLWRLMTGNLDALLLSRGIPSRNEGVERPFLGISKSEIFQFLEEERQGFCVDESNDDLRFLRNKIRAQLIPVLSDIFPRWSERLPQVINSLVLSPERSAVNSCDKESLAVVNFLAFFQAFSTGRMRREHRDAAQQFLAGTSIQCSWPEGWLLTADPIKGEVRLLHCENSEK